VGWVSKDNVARQDIAKLHGVPGEQPRIGTMSSFRPKKV
jgi:uncharacterized protein affecting Mg2+/Co2+ transport